MWSRKFVINVDGSLFSTRIWYQNPYDWPASSAKRRMLLLLGKSWVINNSYNGNYPALSWTITNGFHFNGLTLTHIEVRNWKPKYKFLRSWKIDTNEISLHFLYKNFLHFGSTHVPSHLLKRLSQYSEEKYLAFYLSWWTMHIASLKKSKVNQLYNSFSTTTFLFGRMFLSTLYQLRFIIYQVIQSISSHSIYKTQRDIDHAYCVRDNVDTRWVLENSIHSFTSMCSFSW